MRASLVTALLSLVFAGQTLAQGCPSCTVTAYHCPAQDNSQALVGQTYTNTGSSCCGGTLTCDYQGGGTSVTYTCNYDSTGALTLDADHGFCPSTAAAGAQRRGVQASRNLRSRVAGRTSQRKKDVKNAMEGMGMRRDLGKGKPSRTTEAQ